MDHKDFDHRASLRTMMRTCDTLNQMKSVIASAETIEEAYSLLPHISNEQQRDLIQQHVDNLSMSLK